MTPDPPPREPIRLLVVDDDEELCQLVREYLTAEGFSVEVVHDGELAVRRALADEHMLVVLDVMLPRLGGFEALRRIRARSRVPVLMLTARGTDMDRIIGLEIGADDYLPKPFNPRELVARIHAILRRTRPAADSAATRLRIGDVLLDGGARVVRRADLRIDLTAMEFDVLLALMTAAGRVVTREDLYQAVLGRRLMPDDRAIDMHVCNLRRKLGPTAGGGERIRTIRSVGYQYALPEPVPDR